MSVNQGRKAGGFWGLVEQKGPWNPAPSDLKRSGSSSLLKHAGHGNFHTSIEPGTLGNKIPSAVIPQYKQKSIYTSSPLVTPKTAKGRMIHNNFIESMVRKPMGTQKAGHGNQTDFYSGEDDDSGSPQNQSLNESNVPDMIMQSDTSSDTSSPSTSYSSLNSPLDDNQYYDTQTYQKLQDSLNDYMESQRNNQPLALPPIVQNGFQYVVDNVPVLLNDTSLNDSPRQLIIDTSFNQDEDMQSLSPRVPTRIPIDYSSEPKRTRKIKPSTKKQLEEVSKEFEQFTARKRKQKNDFDEKNYDERKKNVFKKLGDGMPNSSDTLKKTPSIPKEKKIPPTIPPKPEGFKVSKKKSTKKQYSESEEVKLIREIAESERAIQRLNDLEKKKKLSTKQFLSRKNYLLLVQRKKEELKELRRQGKKPE